MVLICSGTVLGLVWDWFEDTVEDFGGVKQ